MAGLLGLGDEVVGVGVGAMDAAAVGVVPAVGDDDAPLHPATKTATPAADAITTARPIPRAYERSDAPPMITHRQGEAGTAVGGRA